MFDEIRQTESFSQVRRMLFLGSMNINLRDLNIIDMGVCLKREYDIDTYIYMIIMMKRYINIKI